jgi:AraC-like DNA-binding protein
VTTAPDYVEVAPPRALDAFVERFWIHRISAPAHPPDQRRLLPDGRMHLVWIAELGLRVAGPAQAPMMHPRLPEMLAVGATFHPGAAPYLLRTPASELVDRRVHVDAIDAALARRIDAVLQAALDPWTAVAAFARTLRRRLDELPDGPDPAVRRAVALLDGDAKATVAAVAAKTSISERELQRRFVHDVGYAPKTLQRVLRLQRFLDVRTADDLAGSAALAGYADQSHLSREVKKLTGMTPTELLAYQH